MYVHVCVCVQMCEIARELKCLFERAGVVNTEERGRERERERERDRECVKNGLFTCSVEHFLRFKNSDEKE